MTPPTKLKLAALAQILYAIYARKSSRKGIHAKYNSTDAQIALGHERVKKDPRGVMVETYADKGRTGANTKRSDFQRMFEDAQAGKFHRLLVFKVDRLSRDFADGVIVRKELEKLGIEVIVMADDIDDTTPTGRYMRHMQMANSEHERAMLIQNVTMRLRHMRQLGQWVGGPAPYGYDTIDKQLIVNTNEAPIVRTIFDHYLEFRSANAVADMLRRKGYPTKQRNRKGAPHSAPQWTKNMVLTILRNPVYAGWIADGETYYDSIHKAIVTRDVFNQAKAVLRDLTIEGESHGSNPDYFLRGLLRCQSSTIDGSPCRHALTPASTRKRKGEQRTEYRYYRCVSHDKKGAHTCASRMLPADAIEAFVLGHIRAASSDHDFMSKLRAHVAECVAYRDRLASDHGKRLAHMPKLHAEADRWVDALERADDPTRTIYQAKVNAAATKIIEADRAIKALSESIALLDNTQAEATWMIDQLSRLDAVWPYFSPENRARLAQSIVQDIFVNEDQNNVSIVVSPLGRRMAGVYERSYAESIDGKRDPVHEKPPQPVRVTINTTLRRMRQRAVSFSMPQADRAPTSKPAAIARSIALAHHLERGLTSGRFPDRNMLAPLLGVSKPRVTQLLLLPLLAPDLQERLLFLETTEQGGEPVSEAMIRPIAMAASWAQQRAMWDRDIAPLLAPSQGFAE